MSNGPKHLRPDVDHPLDYFNFPIPVTPERIEEAVKLGMIRKKDLEVGALYEGHCRNASQAVWHGDHFTYERHKFGDKFDEDINHPEDDDGHDLFIPWKKIE